MNSRKRRAASRPIRFRIVVYFCLICVARLSLVAVASAATAGAPPPVTVAAPSLQLVSLSWLPPTENTDGSVLTDLTRYRIYSGPTPTALVPVVEIVNFGLTRYVLELRDPNWKFFAIAAVNSLGVQSELSGVVGRDF